MSGPNWIDGIHLGMPEKRFQIHRIENQPDSFFLQAHPIVQARVDRTGVEPQRETPALLPPVATQKDVALVSNFYSQNRIENPVMLAISEVTGYGVHELRGTQHLENDLGIDSLKKKRIVALLRAPPETEFQPTIQSWTDFLESSRPSLNQKEIIQLLMQITQEKTGYDLASLDLDANLESDLGIDTIKQAQILGKLRQSYPLSVDSTFRIKDFPTLRHWIDMIQSHKTTSVSSEKLALPHLSSDRYRTEYQPVLEAQFSIRIPSLHYWIHHLSPSLFSTLETQLLEQGAQSVSLTSQEADRPLEASLVDTSVVEAILDFSAFSQSPETAPLDLLKLCQRHASTLKLIQVYKEAHSDLERERDGATAGFARALALEWPHLTIQVIGLERNRMDPDSTEWISHVLQELRCREPIRELSYCSNVRSVPYLVPSPLDFTGTPQIEIGSDSVFVISGGMGGIGLAIARELSRRFNPFLILLGRRSEVELPLEFDPNRVFYRSCDITDPLQIQNLEKWLASAFTQLTGIIHAAGIVEDRSLESKSPESFQRVYSVKTRGGAHLIEMAKNWKAKVFCAFTSIAGRLGNPGQTDYSSANSALTSLVSEFRRSHPDIRSFSMAWGPWDGIGMTAQPELLSLIRSTSSSYGLIPLEEGIEHFLHELIFGGNDLEIVIQKRIVTQTCEYHRGNRCVQEVHFDLSRDSWLSDHRLGSILLPATVALDLLNRNAESLFPKLSVQQIKQFSIHSPLILSHQKPTLVRIHSQAKMAKTSTSCEVHSEIKVRSQSDWKTVFDAKFSFTSQLNSPLSYLDSPLIEGPSRSPPPDVKLPQSLIYGPGPKQIPLGPFFHLLTEVSWTDTPAGRGHIRGQMNLRNSAMVWKEQIPGITLAAVIREGAFHLASIFKMHTSQALLIPASIRSIESDQDLNRLDPQGCPDLIWIEMTEGKENSFDFQIYHSEKVLISRIQGLTMIDLNDMGKDWLHHEH